MLTGPDLGAAIAEAIRRKLDSGAVRSRAQIAAHFDMKPPSLYDWEERGTVSKTKLLRMFEYFSDVVGPEHWCLTEAERTQLDNVTRVTREHEQDRMRYLLASPGAGRRRARNEPKPLAPRVVGLVKRIADLDAAGLESVERFVAEREELQALRKASRARRRKPVAAA